MALEPCGVCLRHVDVAESACPFCGAVRVPSLPRSMLFVRVSRAAVFAGAAVTGCWTSSNAPATQQQQVQQELPPPPDPADPQDSQRPATAAGSVHGVVNDASSNNPLAGIRVELRSLDRQEPPQITKSGIAGEYSFSNVPAGRYQVYVDAAHNSRAGAPQREIVVADQPVVVRFSVPTYNPNPIPAPYGAPPARRRVV